MNDIQQLRFWSYKILPLVYDDSLSYYEVLAKVGKKLNEVITNVNEIPDAIKETIDSDEVAQAIMNSFAKAIATNEGEATYTATAKEGGELIWLNNVLYEVTAPMAVGTNYVVGSNISPLVISDELNHMKGYLSDMNEFYHERSAKAYDTGVYLYYKDNLYITTKDIAVNDILYTDGENQNLKEVTVGDEITKHYTEMHEADNNLQNQIDGNDVDIENLQKKDTNLQNQITSNNNNLNTRISNIVAQAGSDNTEVVDARTESPYFNSAVATSLHDSIIEQINKVLRNATFSKHNSITDANQTTNNLNNLTINPTVVIDTWNAVTHTIENLPTDFNDQSYTQATGILISIYQGTTNSYEPTTTTIFQILLRITSHNIAVWIRGATPPGLPSAPWYDTGLSQANRVPDIYGGNITNSIHDAIASGSIRTLMNATHATHNTYDGSNITPVDGKIQYPSVISYTWNPNTHPIEDTSLLPNTYENVVGSVHLYTIFEQGTDQYTNLSFPTKYQICFMYYSSTKWYLYYSNTLCSENPNWVLITQYTAPPEVPQTIEVPSTNYPTLTSALNFANQHANTTIKLVSAINLNDEITEDSIKTTAGLVARNGVHIIGNSNAPITFELTSEKYPNLTEEELTSARNRVAPINMGTTGQTGNIDATLENVYITNKFGRYCVHDEQNGRSLPYLHKYINCHMNNTELNALTWKGCIGIGFGTHGTIIIDGGTYESYVVESETATETSEGNCIDSHNDYYHEGAENNLIIKNITALTSGIHNSISTRYCGPSTTYSIVQMTNNLTKGEPYFGQGTLEVHDVNVKPYYWNNMGLDGTPWPNKLPS